MGGAARNSYYQIIQSSQINSVSFKKSLTFLCILLFQRLPISKKQISVSEYRKHKPCFLVWPAWPLQAKPHNGWIITFQRPHHTWVSQLLLSLRVAHGFPFFRLQLEPLRASPTKLWNSRKYLKRRDQICKIWVLKRRSWLIRMALLKLVQFLNTWL